MTTKDLAEALRATLKVLREIHAQDAIELALDPQWAQRMARSEIANCERALAAHDAAQSAGEAPVPKCREDGMPSSADERKLRRMYAVRVSMPWLYMDDGEASGTEHGISIDFMREPVADIVAKVCALEVARYQCRAAPAAPPSPAVERYCDIADLIAGSLQTGRAHAYELMRDALRGTAPEPTEAEVVERCIRILLDGKFWNDAPAHVFEAAKNRAEAMRAALEGEKP